MQSVLTALYEAVAVVRKPTGERKVVGTTRLAPLDKKEALKAFAFQIGCVWLAQHRTETAALHMWQHWLEELVGTTKEPKDSDSEAGALVRLKGVAAFALPNLRTCAGERGLAQMSLANLNAWDIVLDKNGCPTLETARDAATQATMQHIVGRMVYALCAKIPGREELPPGSIFGNAEHHVDIGVIPPVHVTLPCRFANGADPNASGFSSPGSRVSAEGAGLTYTFSWWRAAPAS